MGRTGVLEELVVMVLKWVIFQLRFTDVVKATTLLPWFCHTQCFLPSSYSGHSPIRKLLLVLPAFLLLLLLLPLATVSITVSCHCFAVAIPTLLSTSQHHKLSSPLEYSYIRYWSKHRSEPQPVPLDFKTPNPSLSTSILTGIYLR